jgi:uncharacterized OsmC-like protein
MAKTVKRLEYAVRVDREQTAWSEAGGTSIPWGEAWSAEHLVLAGLCRCTIKSLAYHAGRAETRSTADARAHGVVTRRDDGRYGFVQIDVELDVVLDPPLAGEELLTLLGRAEWGCFVGASLTPQPTYRWTVDGEEIR